jgi:hypothetical protein
VCQLGCIMKEKDKRKLQASEMGCSGRAKGFTRKDLIRNEDIHEELDIRVREVNEENYK